MRPGCYMKHPNDASLAHFLKFTLQETTEESATYTNIRHFLEST